MTNKVGLAIRELHRAENDLAAELLQVSSRHKSDHDIFYLGRDLARWSQDHVRELAKHGKNYEVDLDADAHDEPGLLATVRQKGAELIGGYHDPSLLLLKDLREIHRKAAGVSLDWEVLAQTAQALKDSELLNLAKTCHPQTLRQLRWANASLKVNAAQIMVTP
ncbi:hypothetical protein EV651_10995 [Kribbella sp. VKM Ac-2571]|uniref:hypothetical protein n=1 Tax=Kribbella sp. VKM Ac-2571 TaxID=2512222 RepID=UPI00105D1AF4|nr:hypothetical protein [Kribbella sp. VKM Ac-2571]TDO58820.1 hypothetical protein EV651_10995 [Kribbella sp. VKM Ac-2571]